MAFAANALPALIDFAELRRIVLEVRGRRS
jgi:hypothetical protein